MALPRSQDVTPSRVRGQNLDLNDRVEQLQALLDPRMDPGGLGMVPDYESYAGFDGGDRLREASQVAERLCEHWCNRTAGEVDIMFGYDADHDGFITAFTMSASLAGDILISVHEDLGLLNDQHAATGWAAAMSYSRSLSRIARQVIAHRDQILAASGAPVDHEARPPAGHDDTETHLT